MVSVDIAPKWSTGPEASLTFKRNLFFSVHGSRQRENREIWKGKAHFISYFFDAHSYSKKGIVFERTLETIGSIAERRTLGHQNLPL